MINICKIDKPHNSVPEFKYKSTKVLYTLSMSFYEKLTYLMSSISNMISTFSYGIYDNSKELCYICHSYTLLI